MSSSDVSPKTIRARRSVARAAGEGGASIRRRIVHIVRAPAALSDRATGLCCGCGDYHRRRLPLSGRPPHAITRPGRHRSPAIVRQPVRPKSRTHEPHLHRRRRGPVESRAALGLCRPRRPGHGADHPPGAGLWRARGQPLLCAAAGRVDRRGRRPVGVEPEPHRPPSPRSATPSASSSWCRSATSSRTAS